MNLNVNRLENTQDFMNEIRIDESVFHFLDNHDKRKSIELRAKFLELSQDSTTLDPNDIRTILYTNAVNKALQAKRLEISQNLNPIFKKIHKYLAIPRLIGLFGLMLLGFFQKPNWCLGHEEYKNWCRDFGDNKDYFPTSNLFFFDDWTFLALETFLLIFLITNKYVKLIAFPANKELRYRMIGMLAILILTIIGDLLNSIYLLLPFQLNMFLRPLFFVFYSRVIRNAVLKYINILWRSKAIVGLLCFNIFFFACIGKVIFQNFNVNNNAFEDFPSSIENLLLLQTAYNYPDVMTPYYVQNGSSAVFFSLFLLINNIILAKLTLSVIYIHYKDMLTSNVEKLLSRPEIHNLVRRVFERVERITLARRLSLSSVSNKDELDRQNPKDPKIAPLIEKIYKIIYNFNYELITGIGTGVFFMAFLFELQEDSSEDFLNMMQILFLLMNIFFFLELSFIFAYLGIKKFFKDVRLVAGLIINVASSILLIVDLSHLEYSYILILKWYCLLRILRLFSSLARLESLNFAFKAMVMFLPFYIDLFVVLFILFSLFSALGIHIFGGMLNASVDLTPWGKDYLFSNFNDYGQALIFMFQLLITYWGSDVDIYVYLSNENRVKLFFLFFYLTTTFYVLEVLCAFTIELLISQWNLRKKNHYEGEDQKDYNKRTSEILKALGEMIT